MTAEIQPVFGERLQDFWRENLAFFLRDNWSLDLPELREEKHDGELETIDTWQRLDASSDDDKITITDPPNIDPSNIDPLDVMDKNHEAAKLFCEDISSKDLSSEHIHDDEEPILVKNAKADPSAFGILYERYIGRIYRYIYKRVGNKQDTEELTARTFYNALNKLNSYEDRGYPFSAWLFRIAHNIVANWHRDRGRRRLLPLDRLWSYSEDVDTLDQEVERKEKHSALWAAINRLPQERRDLLIYKFSNCLSNVEIGALMNKSESAIKSLYWRTLAALRQDLESAEL